MTITEHFDCKKNFILTLLSKSVKKISKLIIESSVDY